MVSIISNSGPGTINMTYEFAWNILSYTSVSKTFQWLVGEGPLYWYKIEWGNPVNKDCLPGQCVPAVEGISTCSIVPKDCYDGQGRLCYPDPPPPECPPGECQICDQCEVWHVLAAGLDDLCFRLNTETCNRNMHGKVFKKVQKYDRPALCCDVSKVSDITDKYIDIDYCSECNCISWVDPCDPTCAGKMRGTPCDSDTTASLSSGVQQNLEMFGLARLNVPTKSGFNMNEIKIMKPEEDAVITKCGILPSNLKLNHNLARASVLKEFLGRNKLKLDQEIDLVYSKTSNSWQKVIHLNGHKESWIILFSWACLGDDWKSDIHISKHVGTTKQNTKILTLLHGKTSNDSLEVNFDYNTTTNKVTTKQAILVKNKTMHDEIGLFQGEWSKNPYLTLNITVNKKG